jgi:hypothetical protein
LRGWENAQPWCHDCEKINRRSVEHQNSPWNSIIASMFHHSSISKSKPSLFLLSHLIPTLHLYIVIIISLIQQEQKYPL